MGFRASVSPCAVLGYTPAGVSLGKGRKRRSGGVLRRRYMRPHSRRFINCFESYADILRFLNGHGHLVREGKMWHEVESENNPLPERWKRFPDFFPVERRDGGEKYWVIYIKGHRKGAWPYPEDGELTEAVYQDILA